MLIYFVAIAFLATANASFGGKNAEISSYPYQVGILNNKRFVCGGVIVSKNQVLTAARCVDHPEADLTVFSGSNTVRLDGHKVISKAIHESFALNSRGKPINDIAVVRVDPPFDYSESVKPIDINFEDDVFTDGGWFSSKSAVITGWGLDYNGPRNTEELTVLDVYLYSKSKCNGIFDEFGGLSEGQACAGYYPNTRTAESVCSLDAGGPLVKDGKLIGILSYYEGEKCTKKNNYPGVYSEMAYFQDWIKNNVEFDN